MHNEYLEKGIIIVNTYKELSINIVMMIQVIFLNFLCLATLLVV